MTLISLKTDCSLIDVLPGTHLLFKFLFFRDQFGLKLLLVVDSVAFPKVVVNDAFLVNDNIIV